MEVGRSVSGHAVPVLAGHVSRRKGKRERKREKKKKKGKKRKKKE